MQPFYIIECLSYLPANFSWSSFAVITHPAILPIFHMSNKIYLLSIKFISCKRYFTGTTPVTVMPLPAFVVICPICSNKVTFTKYRQKTVIVYKMNGFDIIWIIWGIPFWFRPIIIHAWEVSATWYISIDLGTILSLSDTQCHWFPDLTPHKSYLVRPN